MKFIIALLTATFLTLIPGSFIVFFIVIKKIAESNDVGTKVNLIDFAAEDCDFYCEHDVNPDAIIANPNMIYERKEEETEDDYV